MQIVILGLRRSGTTIFWQTLRQDGRLCCFNEPFNPYLREIPAELPNRSRRELIEAFHEEPERFWRLFAPIGRVEELQEGFSDRQAEWLRFLLARSESVALDTTRCHFKIEALHALAPDAVLVHLYRDPAAVASSHLVPSGSGGRRGSWWVRRRGERGFWTRRERYNNWGVEELVGDDPRSLFGQRLGEIGLDPEAVYALPAVGRLLAWWRLAYERAERDGRRWFGQRFVPVHFERFCDEPMEALRSVYAALGAEPPDLDLSGIHRSHGPHQAADARWRALYEKIGLPPGGLPGASDR